MSDDQTQRYSSDGLAIYDREYVNDYVFAYAGSARQAALIVARLNAAPVATDGLRERLRSTAEALHAALAITVPESPCAAIGRESFGKCEGHSCKANRQALAAKESSGG